MDDQDPPPDRKSINLALQGGGAHGAFAWGVLDKIIEDGRLEIDGICGTSAGAMNGVVYAYGKMKGGVAGARAALYRFWWDISRASNVFGPVRPFPTDVFPGAPWIQEWGYLVFENMTRAMSPYQSNPFNFNPLKSVLEKHVNFREIVDCDCTNIFVAATNVRTGKPRIFRNVELSIDVVMASACLPFLFQAVKIDGEHYWDGGYVGNPALYPMIYDTKTSDILIVHINPIERPDVPVFPGEIMNRINEISFNSSLIRELRAIAFVQKLLHDGWIKEEHRKDLRDIRIHSIRSDEDMRPMRIASKFNPDWGFLTHLRDLGRQRAAAWLDEHFEQVGVEQTVDLRGDYL